MHSNRLPLLILVWLLCSITDCVADTLKSIVILRVTYENGKTSLGSGFFVDHDGLIATADHVLNNYEVDPGAPPYYPRTGSRATLIDVFHQGLPKGIATIRPLIDGTDIVTGRLSDKFWIDLALFRIPITDETRKNIEPLELAVDLPPRLEKVVAYGPTCTRITDKDTKCFVPLASDQAIIQNDPQTVLEYIVSAQISKGYSGGPLVNQSGLVIGVCSRATSEDGPNRAFFIKAIQLRRLLRPPRSIFFEPGKSCANAGKLERLTAIDWAQLIGSWGTTNANLTKEQCDCYCTHIKRAPGIAQYTPFPHEKCPPPHCESDLISAHIRAVSLELNQPDPDLAVIATLYTHIGRMYKDVLKRKSAFKPKIRAGIYREFGDFLYKISTNSFTTSSPGYFNARLFALQAYSNAQRLDETPETYFKMVILLRRLGKDKLAYETEVLRQSTIEKLGGDVSDTPSPIDISRDSTPDSKIPGYRKRVLNLTYKAPSMRIFR